MNEYDELKMRDVMKGKTLTIYFFLLKQHKSVSARELQRIIGLSSPSLVLYHLGRLQELELVKQDDDGFRVSKVVKVGILRFFVVSGRFLLPRYSFYSLFFTSLLLTTLILFDWSLTPSFILLILVLICVATVFWLETMEVWKCRPLG